MAYSTAMLPLNLQIMLSLPSRCPRVLLLRSILLNLAAITLTSSIVNAPGSSVDMPPDAARDSTVEQILMSSLLRSLVVDSA